MPIIIIKGPSQSGKSTIANALRNNQIAFGKGALLLDEDNDGEPVLLLEKLLAGATLKVGVPASEQPWKPGCAIVIVGDAKVGLLAEFEALAPGFAAMHGPVYTVATDRAR